MRNARRPKGPRGTLHDGLAPMVRRTSMSSKSRSPPENGRKTDPGPRLVQFDELGEAQSRRLTLDFGVPNDDPEVDVRLTLSRVFADVHREVPGHTRSIAWHLRDQRTEGTPPIAWELVVVGDVLVGDDEVPPGLHLAANSHMRQVETFFPVDDADLSVVQAERAIGVLGVGHFCLRGTWRDAFTPSGLYSIIRALGQRFPPRKRERAPQRTARPFDAM